MYCTKCGEKRDATDLYCRKYGNLIKQSATASSHEEKKTTTKSMPALILALIGGCVIVLITQIGLKGRMEPADHYVNGTIWTLAFWLLIAVYRRLNWRRRYEWLIPAAPNLIVAAGLLLMHFEISIRDLIKSPNASFQIPTLTTDQMPTRIISDIEPTARPTLNTADTPSKFLSGSDLRYADLSGADLSGADLNYADLQEADLSGADLRGARLYEANLSGADLIAADLREANLSGANLQGARLYGAHLRRADLTGAEYNKYTRFDADFNPKAAGMVLVE